MFHPAQVLLLLFMCRCFGVASEADGCEGSSWLCKQLNQLQQLVLGQNDQLFQLQSMVSQQENLLGWQTNRLLQLEEAVEQLQADKELVSADLKATKQTLESVLASARHESDEKQVPAKPPMGTLVTSQAHDVVARSDDAGQLQILLEHQSVQMEELGSEIKALKNYDEDLNHKNLQQDDQILDAQSSVFVHWGNSECSDWSSLVYSGVIGGAGFQHTGAATNYLCLSLSPVDGEDSIIPSKMAFLYGSEYETGDVYQDEDAVCSVCRANRSTTIMIPGSNVCGDDWQKQYSGYLMAGPFDSAAGSEFICVDSQLQGRLGSSDNRNGKMLVYTVSQCGSLPCAPYYNNRIVTCVVCSK